MAAPRRAPQVKQRPVIRIDGHVLIVEDFTLAELRQVHEVTGVGWTRFNPIVDAHQASAALVAVLSRDVGPTEAQRRVDAMTLREMLTHIVLEPFERDDDRPAEYVDGVPVVDPPATTGGKGTTSSS